MSSQLVSCSLHVLLCSLCTVFYSRLYQTCMGISLLLINNSLLLILSQITLLQEFMFFLELSVICHRHLIQISFKKPERCTQPSGADTLYLVRAPDPEMCHSVAPLGGQIAIYIFLLSNVCTSHFPMLELQQCGTAFYTSV
jgi:hypothetical protein